MQKRYAFGDIHGNSDAFLALLEYIDPDPEEVVLLGDLVGRGLDSYGVINECAQLVDEGVTIIKGNHDVLLTNYVISTISNFESQCKSPSSIVVAKSLQIAEKKEKSSHVRKKVTKVINAQKLYHEDDNFIFVHAGLDPNVGDMDKQLESSLVFGMSNNWKNPRVNHPYSQYVVFGHTPTHHLHPDIKENDMKIWMSHKSKKIALDTGAGFGYKLTCADLKEGIAYECDVVTLEIKEYRFMRRMG